MLFIRGLQADAANVDIVQEVTTFKVVGGIESVNETWDAKFLEGLPGHVLKVYVPVPTRPFCFSFFAILQSRFIFPEVGSRSGMTLFNCLEWDEFYCSTGDIVWKQNVLALGQGQVSLYIRAAD